MATGHPAGTLHPLPGDGPSTLSCVQAPAPLRTCVPPAATQDTRGRSSARVPCCSPRYHTEWSRGEPGTAAHPLLGGLLLGDPRCPRRCRGRGHLQEPRVPEVLGRTSLAQSPGTQVRPECQIARAPGGGPKSAAGLFFQNNDKLQLFTSH